MRISDWSSDVCSSDLADRGSYVLAASRALNTHLPHQAFDRATRNLDALALQLAPHLIRPVDLHVAPPDPLDLRHQQFNAFGARTEPVRGAPKGGVPAISRRGDMQAHTNRTAIGRAA